MMWRTYGALFVPVMIRVLWLEYKGVSARDEKSGNDQVIIVLLRELTLRTETAAWPSSIEV
jgi:hypothetical protein